MLDSIHPEVGAAIAGAVVLTFTLLHGAAQAAETPTIDEIAAKLEKQREAVKSLFVEVHDYTTISVPADVLLSWPHFHNLLALVDQRHEFAFKGPKRYWREEQLKPRQMLRKVKGLIGQPDSCRADNGQVSWNRILDETAKRTRAFNLMVFRSRPDREWVPAPEYFGNIGWLNTNPESKDKFVEAQRAFDLIEMLKHHELRVADKHARLGDATCLVLEGDTEQAVDLGNGPKTNKTHQTFWLDVDHGLAVRQHEHRSELGFGRVVNSDFLEPIPGFWLPKKDRFGEFRTGQRPQGIPGPGRVRRSQRSESLGDQFGPR